MLTVLTRLWQSIKVYNILILKFTGIVKILIKGKQSYIKGQVKFLPQTVYENQNYHVLKLKYKIGKLHLCSHKRIFIRKTVF